MIYLHQELIKVRDDCVTNPTLSWHTALCPQARKARRANWKVHPQQAGRNCSRVDLQSRPSERESYQAACVCFTVACVSRRFRGSL